MTGYNSILSGVNWAVEKDMFLADFVEKQSLPHLALITKGQYLCVGAPNMTNPTLKPYVLIHSRKKLRKVLGQIVKIKENRPAILTDHKVAIPEDYDGFFELLSEDGRPVNSIESVSELARIFPDTVLVRSPNKAYLPENDGELRNLQKTRIVEESEILTIVGKFGFRKETFLRCFDETGRSVYLKMSQKGKFSPVARKDAITGVHYIKNLMDAKRFPVTVKLIRGSFPSDGRKHNHEPVILRLQCTIQEDFVIGYIVQKSSELLSIPLNSHLMVAPCSNHTEIVNRSEFRDLCENCDQHLPNYLRQISTTTDQKLNRNLMSDFVESLGGSKLSDSGKGSLGGSSSSDNSSQKIGNPDSGPQIDPNTIAPFVPDEEIDQIYDYVRGLAPLPDSNRNQRKQSDVLPAKPKIENIKVENENPKSAEKSDHFKPQIAVSPKKETILNNISRSNSSPENNHKTNLENQKSDPKSDESSNSSHRPNDSSQLKPVVIEKNKIPDANKFQFINILHDPPKGEQSTKPPQNFGFRMRAKTPDGPRVRNPRMKPRPISAVLPDKIAIYPAYNLPPFLSSRDPKAVNQVKNLPYAAARETPNKKEHFSGNKNEQPQKFSPTTKFANFSNNFNPNSNHLQSDCRSFGQALPADTQPHSNLKPKEISYRSRQGFPPQMRNPNFGGPRKLPVFAAKPPISIPNFVPFVGKPTPICSRLKT